jgi:uncharacterized protein with HEPN domain
VKHPERIEDYLGHIAEAIARATTYLQTVSDVEGFEKNIQVQDAVVRNIEVIGEAVTKFKVLCPTSSNSIRNFRGHKCAACATSRFTNISLSI